MIFRAYGALVWTFPVNHFAPGQRQMRDGAAKTTSSEFRLLSAYLGMPNTHASSGYARHGKNYLILTIKFGAKDMVLQKIYSINTRLYLKIQTKIGNLG